MANTACHKSVESTIMSDKLISSKGPPEQPPLIRAGTLADIADIMDLVHESTSNVLLAVFGAAGAHARLESACITSRGHAVFVAELNKMSVGHAYGYASTAQALPSDGFAPDASDIVAAFERLRVADSWYLSSLAVRPAMRRRGIGRLLLRRAAQEAASVGADVLSLHVFAEKQPAVALYLACGFVEVGRCALPAHPLVTAHSDLLLLRCSVRTLADATNLTSNS